MATAVLEKPVSVEVYERLAPTAENRIDRERKLILGVKVLGIKSRSPARVIGMPSDEPYTYSIEALRDAVKLYEGVPVNIDHPDFQYERDGSRTVTDGSRKAADRFGRLVNVRLVESGPDAGIYADLHYLENHPMAASILEAAETMPDIFALSHHATTIPVMKDDGRVVIEKIEEVESVDLIGEKPGTTTSLFESEATMPNHLLNAQEEEVVTEQTDDESLLEQPLEAVEAEGDLPAESDMSPDEMMTKSFRQKIMAVLDNELLSRSEKAAKISKILKTEESTMEMMAEIDETDAEVAEAEHEEKEGIATVAEQEHEKKDDETKVAEAEHENKEKKEIAEAEHEEKKGIATVAEQEHEKKEKKVVAESMRKLRAENRNLKLKDRARILLESKGVAATNARVQAMVGVESGSVHKSLIEGWTREDNAVTASSGYQVSDPRSKPMIESAARIRKKPSDSVQDYKEQLLAMGNQPVVPVG